MKSLRRLPTWKKILLTVLLLCSAELAAFALGHLLFGNRLTVTKYARADVRFTQPVRVVQLSDLHGRCFGPQNADLVAAAAEQAPDLIFLTGDIFSYGSTDELETALRLVSDLSGLAPVYYSLGNHEADHLRQFGPAFLDDLTAAGAQILELSYVDTEVRGQPLRIGGAYGYLLTENYRNGPEQTFMKEFTDTDRPCLLLSHLSQGLLAYHCIYGWDLTAAFCGHSHGGQIRLPLLGGLYDPELNWFPQYSKGMFLMNNAAIILSAGLGSGNRAPRLNNPPELVVMDFLPLH